MTSFLCERAHSAALPECRHRSPTAKVAVNPHTKRYKIENSASRPAAVWRRSSTGSSVTRTITASGLSLRRMEQRVPPVQPLELQGRVTVLHGSDLDASKGGGGVV